jgi:hypothetical protein
MADAPKPSVYARPVLETIVQRLLDRGASPAEIETVIRDFDTTYTPEMGKAVAESSVTPSVPTQEEERLNAQPNVFRNDAATNVGQMVEGVVGGGIKTAVGAAKALLPWNWKSGLESLTAQRLAIKDAADEQSTPGRRAAYAIAGRVPIFGPGMVAAGEAIGSGDPRQMGEGALNAALLIAAGKGAGRAIEARTGPLGTPGMNRAADVLSGAPVARAVNRGVQAASGRVVDTAISTLNNPAVDALAGGYAGWQTGNYIGGPALGAVGAVTGAVVGPTSGSMLGRALARARELQKASQAARAGGAPIRATSTSTEPSALLRDGQPVATRGTNPGGVVDVLPAMERGIRAAERTGGQVRAVPAEMQAFIDELAQRRTPTPPSGTIGATSAVRPRANATTVTTEGIITPGNLNRAGVTPRAVPPVQDAITAALQELRPTRTGVEVPPSAPSGGGFTLPVAAPAAGSRLVPRSGPTLDAVLQQALETARQSERTALPLSHPEGGGFTVPTAPAPVAGSRLVPRSGPALDSVLQRTLEAAMEPASTTVPFSHPTGGGFTTPVPAGAVQMARTASPAPAAPSAPMMAPRPVAPGAAPVAPPAPAPVPAGPVTPTRVPMQALGDEYAAVRAQGGAFDPRNTVLTPEELAATSEFWDSLMQELARRRE